ncbi:hypothetical protein E4T56_gene15995 [Termitomyces sp. T112]|nr:hypothetical protein E4T56_gene15995 [Termitomyces sp. T112]
MTDLSTAVSVNAFNSLSVSMSDLTNLVKDMALRMGPATSAPTPSPAAPLTTMPAEFVPPIMAAAANSTSLTAPTSLHACFPNVEAAVIMAIIMHKFKTGTWEGLGTVSRERIVTLPPLQRRDPRDAGSKSGIGRAWESKLINIDQTAASSGSMGKEVKGWTHPGVPQLVVMSSSAYSPTASKLPSPPSQPSSSKDSEGCQDCCWIEAMYRSHEGGLSHVPQNTDWSFAELSAAMAGPSGPSSGMDVMQPLGGVAPSTRSKSGICLGVVRLVSEGLRVVQAEVTPEQFAKVVGRARGPPTFKWCQAAAPCEFEVPASGVQRDTSVCLPCRSQHEKCSVTLSWHATCVVAEQGWDRDWVAAQLEEGQKGRVSGRGSRAGEGEWVSAPAMKVGPLRGGRREGAPSTQEKGKRRASPSPEAGPSKRVWGEQVMGGPPGSAVYSPTSGAPVEQSADRSWSVAEAFLRRRVESLERSERDLAWKDKDITVGTAAEQLSHLQELEVWMVHLQVRAEAAEVGSSAGEVWVAAERVRWREEWLANEAASGQQGVLHWAREHCILLNGVSAALGSIHDGLVRMPGDLPPELGQGVTQMGRLLAGHRRRAMADPGA